MKNIIFEDHHKTFIINVLPNKTKNKGKFLAYAKDIWSVSNTLENSVNLPVYTSIGDNIDELIEELKQRIDKNCQFN